MIDSKLGFVDRATLRTWRVANVAGWSVVALLGALVLRMGFESGAAALDKGFADAYALRQQVEYLATVAVPAQIVCGLFIGMLLGSRVLRAPVWTAGILSVLFAVVTVWVLGTSNLFPFGFRMWMYVVLTLPTLIAVVTARRVARRRPGAR
jgi:hypothetical protein